MLKIKENQKWKQDTVLTHGCQLRSESGHVKIVQVLLAILDHTCPLRTCIKPWNNLSPTIWSNMTASCSSSFESSMSVYIRIEQVERYDYAG